MVYMECMGSMYSMWGIWSLRGWGICGMLGYGMISLDMGIWIDRGGYGKIWEDMGRYGSICIKHVSIS